MGDRAVVVPLDDPEVAADAIVGARPTGRDRRGGRGRRPGCPGRRHRGRAARLPPQPARRGRRHPRQGGDAARAGTRRRCRNRGSSVDSDAPDCRACPWVVKPLGLLGEPRRDPRRRCRRGARRRRPDRCHRRRDRVLVEEYVPGVEVAVEGLLRDGDLEVLAVFDKPDPLVGPYFEETIYVTPSRLDPTTLAARRRTWRRVPAPRSVWSKARCTPSCGSTATACG